jgi:hypothetical protein
MLLVRDHARLARGCNAKARVAEPGITALYGWADPEALQRPLQRRGDSMHLQVRGMMASKGSQDYPGCRRADVLMTVART